MSDFDSLYSDAFTEAFTPVFSSEVTYSRGEDSFSVSSFDSKISAESQIEFGVQLVKEAKEFLILKTDLVLDEVVIEPASGDLITDNYGVWEVASYPSTPDYELDVTGIHWRIKTVKYA